MKGVVSATARHRACRSAATCRSRARRPPSSGSVVSAPRRRASTAEEPLRGSIDFGPASDPAGARVRIGEGSADEADVVGRRRLARAARPLRRAGRLACRAPYGAGAGRRGRRGRGVQAAPCTPTAARPSAAAAHRTSPTPPSTTASTRTPARGRTSRELVSRDLAVVGCGAGGSAALYVLAMQPGLAGEIALIEHGRHKLSNLNRYLMTTATRRARAPAQAGDGGRPSRPLRAAAAPDALPGAWEQLDAHPWRSCSRRSTRSRPRWAIQRRAVARRRDPRRGGHRPALQPAPRRPRRGASSASTRTIPTYALKQRAARWGASLDTVRAWWAENVAVTAEMLAQLADDAGQAEPGAYAELRGHAVSRRHRC